MSARILTRVGPVTHKDINLIQASQDQPITEAELANLVGLTFTTYTLTQKGVITQAFLAIDPRKVPVGEGR
jgi:hypothetical protein